MTKILVRIFKKTATAPSSLWLLLTKFLTKLNLTKYANDIAHLVAH